MELLDNIFFSNERKFKEKTNTNNLFFDKNIAYIYQKNTGLLEESVKNIIKIESLGDMKALYSDFFIKSEYKRNVFQKIQREIATQPIHNKYTEELFSPYLNKISSYFTKQITTSSRYQEVKEIIHNEQIFFEKLQKKFEKQIFRLSYRTLILDFNFQKKEGNLQGKTEQERKDYYNHILLKNSTYMIEFFHRFPCLLRIISNEIRQLKKFILELLQRYTKDCAKIAIQLLNNKNKKIQYVDFGLGDAHCDGRRTTKVIFEDDVIIYKPRNASPDFFYKKLMDLWNQDVPQSKIKCAKGVFRDTYSWFEYIEYKKSTNQQQIRNFYKRLGIQMAFLYACSATDFHFENMIAHGEFPILIDLECLFQIPHNYTYFPADQYDDVHSIIQNKITTSVYAVGLLPTSLGGNNIDISGIGSSGTIQSIKKVPYMNVNAMKIEQKVVEFKNTSKNRPVLEENSFDPSGYTAYILEGFKLGYTYIQENKGKLLKLIKKHKHNIHVRYLLKGTVNYASILNASVHPRLLHNYIDRELYIAKMCMEYNTKNLNKEIAQDEYKSLMNGDIPYYSNQIASKHLIRCGTKMWKDFFNETPYEFVTKKIDNFCESDLEIQMDIIKCSMQLNRERENLNRNILQNTSDFSYDFKLYECFTKKAQEIAQYVTRKSLFGKSPQNRSWINISIIDKKFHLSAMNDSFYDGLSGISFMYLALWVVTNEKEYLEIAEKIIHDIFNRMNYEKNNMSLGAFTGVSSILYTMLNFYVFTKNEKYLAYADSLLPIIQDKLIYDDTLDIISGAAGTLVVLVRYYELKKNKKILKLAKQCGDFLIRKGINISEQEFGWITVDKTPLTGFSHGNAGIIFALQLLNKYLCSHKIKSVINQALRFETNNKYQSHWKDLRTINSDTDRDTTTWCHGSAGILISRLALQSANDSYISNQSKIDIEHAVSNLKRFGFGKEPNLCHGDVGNALILMYYGQQVHDNSSKILAANYLYECTQSLVLNGSHRIDPLGLMNGLAGISYGLLCCCDSRLPNILSLELGNSK
ncbi:type 2 lanthipeptide synthetase LanM [Bacillus thuringiensis]|uniref:type 2 lanthipeptide synthetase LanM n=1 Tax=Bacillus thuringiensis TaxID=1428 RepID=UPI002FFFAEE0